MSKRAATKRTASANSTKAIRPTRRAPEPAQTDEGDAAERAETTHKFETVVDNLAFDGGYD